MTNILAGPVIGYRRWTVTPKGWLGALGLPVIWYPGVQTAECHGTHTVNVAEYCDDPATEELGPWDSTDPLGRRGPYRLPDGKWIRIVQRKSCIYAAYVPPDHPAPSLRSRCGIWAHKQPIPDCTCPDPTGPAHGAVGVVRMWGRGVEHDDGWRAQYAELVAIVDHSGRLTQDYGVPRYPTTADMWAEWAPDRHGWAARHDACWCEHKWTPVGWHHSGFIAGGGSANYASQPPGPSSAQLMRTVAGQLYTWSALAAFPDEDEQAERDAKAKALEDKQIRLEDKQTRNADHPGQDRPDKQRRKRRR
jgi:hypothetical protein